MTCHQPRQATQNVLVLFYTDWYLRRSYEAKTIACTLSQDQLCINGVNNMLLNNLGSLGLHALGLSWTKVCGVICFPICFSCYGEHHNTFALKLQKTPLEFPSAWRWVDKDRIFIFRWTLSAPSEPNISFFFFSVFFFFYLRCYCFPTVETPSWGKSRGNPRYRSGCMQLPHVVFLLNLHSSGQSVGPCHWTTRLLVSVTDNVHTMLYLLGLV